MIQTISPQDAKKVLREGGEVALLDLREPGPFSLGHPLFAVPCPFSSLEIHIAALVPRANVPIILIDSADGIAQTAADILSGLGYCNISIIKGGVRSWEEAGFTLYKGVNVASKALGELAEHAFKPQTIDADLLASWMKEGRKFHFFDCRPPGEYEKMTVPGATCIPNGELAHRLSTISSDAPILLTCAGRTRGLIGAISLQSLAPDREIYALENGTQGWALSGRALSRNNIPAPLPQLNDISAEQTQNLAQMFIRGKGIPTVSAQGISCFLSDETRTTFLIDVRSQEEAQNDPLPGFVHALSGQLVQATDQWIGVRNSRVVLADDTGLRAGMTAWWLRMLGYEPFVCLIDEHLRALTLTKPVAWSAPTIAECTASKALAAVERGEGIIVDLRSSDAYRSEHVAGAIWSLRPLLNQIAPKPGLALYLIDNGDARAQLAAGDLLKQGHQDVRIVQGGKTALYKAGATLKKGSKEPRREQSPDITWFADGRHDGNLDASRLYLEWEQGLVAQLDASERACFVIPSARLDLGARNP